MKKKGLEENQLFSLMDKQEIVFSKNNSLL